MIPPAVIERFRDAQRKLLSDTYDEAWRAGVAAYEPVSPLREADSRSGEHRKTLRRLLALATAAGMAEVARLLANRLGGYQPPPNPDPTRKARALSQAYRGVDRMGGELAYLYPSAEQLAATIAGYQAATADATEAWAASNVHRLDVSGDTAAWAGEQIGYADAATADGMLLAWQDVGDDHECEDCEALAQMPPMAETDWPAAPGEGVACAGNCRCSLEAYDPWTANDLLNVDNAPDLQGLLYPLTDDEQRALSQVTDRIASRLVGV